MEDNVDEIWGRGLKFIKLNYFVKVYFGLVEFHCIGK